MNNAVYNFEDPRNETILNYAKNSSERTALFKEIERQSSEQIDIPLIIGGKEVRTGKIGRASCRERV